MSATTTKKQNIKGTDTQTLHHFGHKITSPLLDDSVTSEILTDDTIAPFRFVGEKTSFPPTVNPWVHHLLGMGQLALYIGTTPGFSSKDCIFDVLPTESGIQERQISI